MNIANYSQSLPAKGWAHDSSLALWGVAVTGLGPEMQTLTAPSDCSLGQDWWLLLNHFFISSNAGTTIPGFLLEVQESLTARVSGMASDWFCIQPVLLSQTHGFPWGWCFPVYLGASSAPAQTCLFLSDFYCLSTEWGSWGKAVASLVLESLSEGGSWLGLKQMLCGNNYLRETQGGSARDNETPRDLGVSFPGSRGVSGLELELAAVVEISFLFCFFLLPPPARGPEQRVTFGARAVLPVQNLGCDGAVLDVQIAELSCSPAWWVLSPWPVSRGTHWCVRGSVISWTPRGCELNAPGLQENKSRMSAQQSSSRTFPGAHSLASSPPISLLQASTPIPSAHQKRPALFSVYLRGFQPPW